MNHIFLIHIHKILMKEDKVEIHLIAHIFLQSDFCKDKNHI